MKNSKAVFRQRLTTAVSILLFVGCQNHIQADTMTNSVPPNLYLTDDGRVFWHTSSGKTVIATEKIKVALGLEESRPAEQDPQGHWGKVTDGFQLSLRFEKSQFAIGEPIAATILIRNVSDDPLTYHRMYITGRPSPINILASWNQKALPTRSDGHPLDVSAATELTLLPKTQHKYQIHLNDYYDLTNSGGYVFLASYIFPKPDGKLELSSLPVSITITNVGSGGQ